jgi:predicted MPP superfamily phosphohydrolase
MMKIKWLLPGLCLLAQGALAVTNFEFVVIGDTRPRFESENFRIFEGLIPKINAAQPAFVINLGDLIYGYGPLRKRSQWDQYAQVVRGFTMPYYQLPGNHDVHSRELPGFT